jgi:hypothetical protein
MTAGSGDAASRNLRKYKGGGNVRRFLSVVIREHAPLPGAFRFSGGLTSCLSLREFFG